LIGDARKEWSINEKIAQLTTVYQDTAQNVVRPPDLNWVGTFEALMVIHRSDEALMQALQTRLYAHRYSAIGGMSPIIITSMLRAAVWVDQNFVDDGAAWIKPCIIGTMLLEYSLGASGVNNSQLACSKEVVAAFSDALTEYLRVDGRPRACGIMVALGDVSAVRDAKKIFDELSHRLFGMLDSSEKIRALRPIYAPIVDVR
jgi:hypothetical protein